MGKYDGWDRYFQGLQGDERVLDFAQLEALIDGKLPLSAYQYAVWWVGPHYYAKWRNHGWYAHPDLERRIVRFDRQPGRRGRPSRPREARPPAPTTALKRTDQCLILLGCVKTKLPSPAPAKDLYISALWHKRRAYAEVSGQPWRILSAKHGMLDPDEVIEPYDLHLASQTSEYQRAWSTTVAEAVLALLRQLGLSSVEIHASSAYVLGLRPLLRDAGVRVIWPFEGRRQGEHLQWYEGPNPRAACQGDSSPDEAEPWEWPALQQAAEVGPFEFKWPDSVEAFTHGWAGSVVWQGRKWRFRHGVGARVVYGRLRVHTVTWFNDVPAVEGVAADDYDRSLSLLSLIKDSRGSIVKDRKELDGAYRFFNVVDHRTEIDAPYSRFGLAVKIRLDDLVAWVAHGLLRRSDGLAPPKHLARPPEPPDLDPEDRAERPAPNVEQRSWEDKLAIAKRLLEFAAEPAQMPAADGIPDFTPIRAANELLVVDPFAFLLAVIADYQIPGERAWSLPYLLRERLGHLDPVRMLAEPEQTIEAVARRPSLHRYINRVPEFILAACRIVLDRYGGDARRIWAGTPAAAELQRRLREFPGISQKKAAMAVEILERDLGVPIRELHGSDIAYDVHVRRVFLRTGLAERDDPDHMIGIARRLNRERPGALDFPAWTIGRTWCHPANPECSKCVLFGVCARRI
jgi:uncharacterized HhH-GPD family protein